MEDYIEILLGPIRNERILGSISNSRIAEEKQKKHTPFSALQDLFISLHEKLGPIFREAYAYDQNYRMRFIHRDSRLFPARLEGYAYKHYVDLDGNIAVTTDFYVKFILYPH